MNHLHTHCPSYATDLYQPGTFKAVCDWTVDKARRAGIQAIAASGHSGLPVAAVVAHVLNIPLLAVRQPTRETHDSGAGLVNGSLPAGALEYGIVDDFISSGTTIKRIADEVYGQWPLARATHIFCWWMGRTGKGRSNAMPASMAMHNNLEDVLIISRLPTDHDLPF